MSGIAGDVIQKGNIPGQYGRKAQLRVEDSSALRLKWIRPSQDQVCQEFVERELKKSVRPSLQASLKALQF